MIELMVAMAIMMIVSGIVMTALGQLRNSQKTITNRTAMHSGVRGATQLLQQEIGQAGLIKLPSTPTLSTAVTVPPASPGYCDGANPATGASWYTVSSVAGMFPMMVLTTLDGDAAETVKVNAVNTATNQIQACFTKAHAASTTKLDARGAFATGVIPDTGIVSGSTPFVLKLYGDINGDGNMVYVEYTCDPYVTHNLYRNAMPFSATTKQALNQAQILLSNVIPNPGDPSCFHYERETVVVGSTPFTFVLNVAVTLTVETEQIDPITKQRQTETKALLNVSPRNVVNAWSYAGMGYTHRIQSTPPSVVSLLPPPS